MVTYTLWLGALELGEYDGSGALVRRFVPDGSGAMDARVMTLEASGAVLFHHTDRQGSVVATTNAAGQVMGTAAYSPYGEFAPGTTAPPPGSPFGYTGRQYDPETGLYQYRARYYSPRLGVFISTDPIGTGDDPNLYGYVGQDPVNKTDPTGMCEEIEDANGNKRKVGICGYGHGDPAKQQAADSFVAGRLTDPNSQASVWEADLVAQVRTMYVRLDTETFGVDSYGRHAPVDGGSHEVVNGASIVTIDLTDIDQIGDSLTFDAFDSSSQSRVNAVFTGEQLFEYEGNNSWEHNM